MYSVPRPVSDPEEELAQRLDKIPDRARVRGVFFDSLEKNVKAAGIAAPITEKRLIYKLYPVKDLLRRSLDVGKVISPTDPHQGIRTMFGYTSGDFVRSWFGGIFLKYVAPDPIPAFRWIERSRDYLANYGYWRIEVRSERYVIFHMFDEYLWIDSIHRGGCEGLLARCGLRGTVESDIDHPFQGRLHVSWEPHFS